MSGIVRSSRQTEKRVLDTSSNTDPKAIGLTDAHEPATPTQQSFWLMNQLERNNNLANISAAYRLRGSLSESQIASAFQRFWERHPESQTTYRMIDSEIRRLPNSVVPEFEYADLRGTDDTECRSHVSEVHNRSFDVCRESPFRPAAFRIADDEHVILLASNHIASDEWTGAIAFQDTFAALAHGEDSPAWRKLAPRASYSDFVADLQQFVAGADGQSMLDEWQQHLQGCSPQIDLPTDKVRTDCIQYDGASVGYALTPAISAAVRETAKSLQVTPFVLLYSAWQLFLSRICNQETISQATPMLGRPKKHLRTAGCFSNPAVLRVDVAAARNFADLATQVREELAFSTPHSQMPFELILDALGLSQQTRVQPFRQVGFNFRRLSTSKGIGVILNPLHDDNWLSEGAVELAGYGLRQQEGQHELGLEIFDTGDTMQCLWKYRTALWDRETIHSLGRAFNTVLEGCLRSPDDRLRALSLAGADSPAAVATGPSLSLPARSTLISAAIDKANELGDTPAVAETQSARTLTYSQLAQRSGQLAALLKGKGLGRGHVVGISMPRGVDMVLAVLGSMRSGATNLPLDYQLPIKRLAFMCQDAGARCVITTKGLADRFPKDVELVLLDDDDLLGDLEQMEVSDECPATSEDLAYIIYTSGSTGKPKGVAVEHGPAFNDVVSLAAILDTGPEDTVLATTALSFDPSIEDLFLPLINGAKLVIVDETTVRDGAKLASSITEHDATVMHMTPSHWSLLLESGWPGKSNLTAISGGEALRSSFARLLRKKVASLINVYGPTEAVINCTWHDVQDAPDDSSVVSIGKPKHNTKVFVLDQHCQPLPVGIAGELCIGGQSVAQGYLNLDELTRDRFINLAIDGSEHRVYRTGDRARLDHNGEIEYLGRLDDQIKVRGYRIELGEIEAALRAAPGVRDAAVTAKELAHAEVRLFAFVTTTDDSEVDVAAIQDYLSTILPAYMLPQRIVTLKSLPLNANRKVDRSALNEIPLGEISSADAIPPEPGMEKTLAAIWTEILTVEVADRNADFFDLGGHSLLAMRSIDRINQRVGASISMVEFFANPALYQQAALLERRTSDDAPQEIISAQDRHLEAPLSFTQERLWVLGQLDEASVAYNIVGGVEINGDLDLDCMNVALRDVVTRHRIMRAFYVMTDDGLKQRFHEDIAGLAIERVSFSDRSVDDAELAAAGYIRQVSREAFDLAAYPLFRLVAIEITSRRTQLVGIFQHIMFDGWSARLFVNELQKRYREVQLGSTEALPAPAIEFADYAVWQRNQFETEGASNKHLAYWLEKMRDDPTLLRLPYDRPRPLQPSYKGDSIIRHFSADLTKRIKNLARSEDASTFMLLLAAFKVLLRRYSGESQITVGSPVAGRRTKELEELIGCFINTLALRTTVSGDDKFLDVLANVKQTCLDGLDHQDMPLTYLASELSRRGSDGVIPLFQTLLVLQNYEQPDFGIPGLDVQQLHLANGGAQFELSLFMRELDDRIQVTLQYNSKLFDEATAARIFDHYRTLLNHVTHFPLATVDRTTVLPDEERRVVLEKWNRAGDEALAAPTLPQLLQPSMITNSTRVAVESRDESLTYGELDARANSIAAELGNRGVTAGELVGISMQRSPDMLATILGIHRAGAAFLPLDPGFPVSRLDYMISDSGTKLVLVDYFAAQRLNELTSPVDKLDVEDIAASKLRADMAPVGKEENPLAYVLYTSGSTGAPKGVAVGHKSVVNFLQTMREKPGLTSDDRLVAVTTLGFDISVLELLLPLLVGARVILADATEQTDGRELAKLLSSSRASVCQATPSTWRMLLDSGWDAPEGFKVLCGGEALSRNLADRLLANGAEVWNMYGPTETTVWSTCARITADAPIHIGRPIANTTTYILDDTLEPVPLGIVGELYIGGGGLALGYLNRPELNEDRFVADPFATQPGAKMYRTGDEVFVDVEGNIHWLRRKDNQIKLRGFRIELGEIENVVGQHPSVQQCVVLLTDNDDTEKQIIAFVTNKKGKPFSAMELRRHTLKSLPHYMTPHNFVQLEEMPLTPNGKVDSNALMSTVSFGRQSSAEYVEPEDGFEGQLAEIWKDVLRVDQISRFDNFFELGGDSLSAVRVITEYSRKTNQIIKPQYLLMNSLSDAVKLAATDAEK